MISVVIGTFGSDRWRDLAWSRAYASVPAGVDVIVQHEDTLALARNRGAANATQPWLCFLDADDELHAGYLDAMWQTIVSGRGDGLPLEDWPGDRLFTPQVQYVRGKQIDAPKFWPEVAPSEGNWLVIGTVVPRALFQQVGGFEEWPLYEDWALFARMQKAGAEIVKVPGAVYVAHRNPRGRNQPGENTKRKTREQIRRAVFPELYEEVEA